MQNFEINPNIKEKIVLALDVPTKKEAMTLVTELKDYVGCFKVGLQLFMAEGYEIIDALQALDAKVFFDVKLHDIPNTTAQAGVSIIRRGIDFFNIHSLGTSKMMAHTVETIKKAASKEGLKTPTILGVTILSSTDQNTLRNELKIPEQINNYVVHLAKQCQNSGLSGVVASAHEAKNIKQACGDDFIILCPGIRPLFSSNDDQARIVTPKKAIANGADYIVIGRAVTKAEDKILAMKKIHQEISELL